MLASLHCYNVMNNCCFTFLQIEKHCLVLMADLVLYYSSKQGQTNQLDVYSQHLCYDQAKFRLWLCPVGLLAKKHPGTQSLPPPTPSHFLGSKRCMPRVLLMRNWHCQKSGSAQGKFTQLAKVITWWDAVFLLKYTCGLSRAHYFIVVYFWSNRVYSFHYTALQQPRSCRGCPHWQGIYEALIPRLAKQNWSWCLCALPWPRPSSCDLFT